MARRISEVVFPGYSIVVGVEVASIKETVINGQCAHVPWLLGYDEAGNVVLEINPTSVQTIHWEITDDDEPDTEEK